MPFESVTNQQIEELLQCPKRVLNPGARKKEMDGHEQFNYNVLASDEFEHRFLLFKRQNLKPGMEDDFSCGLVWVTKGGDKLTLVRYNGSSHDHPNHLEGDRIGFCCHIHIATERYIQSGRSPEGFAECTKKYRTMKGAFHSLVNDCNISGIETEPNSPEQVNLFGDGN